MIPKELHGSLGCGTYKATDKSDADLELDGKRYRQLKPDEILMDGDVWTHPAHHNRTEAIKQSGWTGRKVEDLMGCGTKEYTCYRLL